VILKERSPLIENEERVGINNVLQQAMIETKNIAGQNGKVNNQAHKKHTQMERLHRGMNKQDEGSQLPDV
jgi:hypothetical protein